MDYVIMPLLLFHYVSCKASPVAQLVKNLPAMQETWFDVWVGKIPWRRERLPTPYSGLENSMDRGVTWWATGHGVTKRQMQLKRLSSSSSMVTLSLTKEAKKYTIEKRQSSQLVLLGKLDSYM